MAEPDGAGVPDLSGLPGTVQAFIYGLLAIGVVATGVVGRFGWRMGKTTTPEKSQSNAAVAAVIVDPEALNRLNSTGQAINQTLGQLRDLMGQQLADQREDRQEREVEEEVQRRVDQQLKERRARQKRVARRPAG